MSSMLHTATWLRRAGYQYLVHQYCTGTPLGLRNLAGTFYKKNSFFNGYTMSLTTKLGSVAPVLPVVVSTAIHGPLFNGGAVAVSTQVLKKSWFCSTPGQVTGPCHSPQILYLGRCLATEIDQSMSRTTLQLHSEIRSISSQAAAPGLILISLIPHPKRRFGNKLVPTRLYHHWRLVTPQPMPIRPLHQGNPGEAAPSHDWTLPSHHLKPSSGFLLTG